MKPNKEAITKWVEALESEDLGARQRRGMLVSVDGRMCAIGARNYAYLQENEVSNPTYGQIIEACDDAERWVGIRFDVPIGEMANGQVFDTIDANDHLGMTFPEIAQHLRKKYL